MGDIFLVIGIFLIFFGFLAWGCQHDRLMEEIDHFFSFEWLNEKKEKEYRKVEKEKHGKRLYKILIIALLIAFFIWFAGLFMPSYFHYQIYGTWL
jgi:hypothetical protein